MVEMQIHHELQEEVRIKLGCNCVEADEPEADITICNGFYHFKPRNDGTCATVECDCRDRQEQRDRYSEHLYHKAKHDYWSEHPDE